MKATPTIVIRTAAVTEISGARLVERNEPAAGLRRKEEVGDAAGQPDRNDRHEDSDRELPARLVALPDGEKGKRIARGEHGNADEIEEKHQDGS